MFRMKHLLMVVYKVCSNKSPGFKRALLWGPMYRWATSGPSWPSCSLLLPIYIINQFYFNLNKLETQHEWILLFTVVFFMIRVIMYHNSTFEQFCHVLRVVSLSEIMWKWHWNKRNKTDSILLVFNFVKRTEKS
jgi:hypothetical protein